MLSIRDSVRIPGRVRITYWLLAINVLSWLAADRMGITNMAAVAGVVPAQAFGEFQPVPGLPRAPILLTVFWAMFLHGGLGHVLSNMIALFLFGPNVEAFMGRVRFLLFYLGCGVFGFLCEILFNPSSQTPIIGASGAVSGLFGAYFVLFTRHSLQITIGRSYYNKREILIPVRVILIVWLASQIFNSLLPGMSNIAFFTHIGGFLCGLFLANGGKKKAKSTKFRVYFGNNEPND